MTKHRERSEPDRGLQREKEFPAPHGAGIWCGRGLLRGRPDGFSVGQDRQKANVRRVEPRNAPTTNNAVFHHRNFWDLRAQNLFNGMNPFGNRDANAFLYRADDPSNPQKTTVSLDNSSLASQAVGPPTNRFEISAYAVSNCMH